jgi:SSS family solute:Na+ symporter
VIFLLGMFWKRATEAGALVAAVGSVVISVLMWAYFQQIAFMNRMGVVFLTCLALGIVVSLLQKPKPQSSTIDVTDVDYSTSLSFNIASLAIIAILVALYTIWW